MNLIIDVGNTQFKICVFDQGVLIHSSFHKKLNQKLIDDLFLKFNIEKCIYSETRNISYEDLLCFIPESIKVIELSYDTKLPIAIDYNTPKTLGKDRIAAAVGASVLHERKTTLIIDIGTALTIDLMDSQGVFHGGIISPGPEIRYRSLSEFTGKLPLLEPSTKKLELCGKSTYDAIFFGVQNGILFEINEYILRYTQEYPDLQVLLTGGYAYLFDKKIKYPIFAELFLVPLGLNRILDYNDN